MNLGEQGILVDLVGDLLTNPSRFVINPGVVYETTTNVNVNVYHALPIDTIYNWIEEALDYRPRSELDQYEQACVACCRGLCIEGLLLAFRPCWILILNWRGKGCLWVWCRMWCGMCSGLFLEVFSCCCVFCV